MSTPRRFAFVHSVVTSPRCVRASALAMIAENSRVSAYVWRRAIGIFRVKVTREQRARLNVLGFGGGVSELFLMLAHHEGHRALFCSGSPDRRKHLEGLGIESIDQTKFHRFVGRDDVKAFGAEVRKRTGGEGAHIVCDMMRGPVFPAGMAVMARQGVNVSAGWQLGMNLEYNSANCSVRQLTIDHTHYETLIGVAAATELYGSVFKPTVHREIYAFEDLPRAFEEMHQNTQTGIPIVRVAKKMPAAVKDLIP